MLKTQQLQKGVGGGKSIWEESKERELTERGLKKFVLNLGSLRSRR